jgi:hypothetical protein
MRLRQSRTLGGTGARLARCNPYARRHARLHMCVPGRRRGMNIMMTRTAKTTLALSLAGTLAMAAAGPTWAAPVSTGTAAVKAAAPTPTAEVRYLRHHHRGFGPGAAVGGLALGLAGAALAAPYYYDAPYAYDYGPSYSYGPGYAYGPGYGWGGGYHRHHYGW